VKTVKEIAFVSRPSVVCTIATDWVTGGCLKWCLMYSRFLHRFYSYFSFFFIYYLNKNTYHVKKGIEIRKYDAQDFM
jgi:hypothetical protein